MRVTPKLKWKALEGEKMSNDEERTVRVVERRKLVHNATSGGEERRRGRGETKDGGYLSPILFFACCTSSPGVNKAPSCKCHGINIDQEPRSDTSDAATEFEKKVRVGNLDSQKRIASATTTNEGDQGHAALSDKVPIQGAFGAELLERSPHQLCDAFPRFPTL